MEIQPLRTNGCIEDVIEKYSEMIYRLAFARVKSKSNADDIFQEVFLRYIRKCPSFENEEHRKAWLIKVTLNCSKKLWSSAWTRKTVALETEIACEIDFTFELEEENLLHLALLKLPEKYRIVIHLFYYEDLKIEEISKILNIKPSTIRAQLTRGRAMLKLSLKDDYIGDTQATKHPDLCEKEG